MRIKTQDGRTFQGTALQIVRQMQSLSLYSHQPLVDYIAESVVRANEVDGAYINPEGDTDDALAGSFVAEMLRAGLAEELK